MIIVNAYFDLRVNKNVVVCSELSLEPGEHGAPGTGGERAVLAAGVGCHQPSGAVRALRAQVHQVHTWLHVDPFLPCFLLMCDIEG
jgi:hypothetical protein